MFNNSIVRLNDTNTNEVVNKSKFNGPLDNPEGLIAENELLKETSIPQVEIENNTKNESKVNEADRNVFSIDFDFDETDY